MLLRPCWGTTTQLNVSAVVWCWQRTKSCYLWEDLHWYGSLSGHVRSTLVRCYVGQCRVTCLSVVLTVLHMHCVGLCTEYTCSLLRGSVSSHLSLCCTDCSTHALCGSVFAMYISPVCNVHLVSKLVMNLHCESKKNCATFIFTVTLANVGRFLKFFQCRNQKEMAHNKNEKFPTVA